MHAANTGNGDINTTELAGGSLGALGGNGGDAGAMQQIQAALAAAQVLHLLQALAAAAAAAAAVMHQAAVQAAAAELSWHVCSGM